VVETLDRLRPSSITGGLRASLPRGTRRFPSAPEGEGGAREREEEEHMLRKILAVDDSALIHQMYKLFLSRYKSCKLVSAMNGL
jgi:hypothetical protein